MFFELRQYQIKPGQMDNWVKYMDEVIVPFQLSKGMVIIGNWSGVEEENLYVWIRRFENEDERQRLYKAVYESDTWTKEVKPQVDKMLDRDKGLSVKLIQPSPMSIIR